MQQAYEHAAVPINRNEANLKSTIDTAILSSTVSVTFTNVNKDEQENRVRPLNMSDSTPSLHRKLPKKDHHTTSTPSHSKAPNNKANKVLYVYV